VVIVEPYKVPETKPHADIEQPLTRRNLINLAHMLPKQSKEAHIGFQGRGI
jgi:hypothetical protein